MWRLYLTNFWLLLMATLALPFLLLRFWSKNNTNLLMYIYALVAQKISGIQIAIEGKENMPAEPAVYVLNHQSALDGIPLGMLRIPRLAIIGKKEVAYIPFIGWTFYLAGNVLLNRADGRKAKGQLDAGIDAIRRRRVSIAIFPEGSRNRDAVGFLPFKKGGFQMAIDAQVLVVPVVIQSFKHVYDKTARKMQRGTVRVRVLPCIETKGLIHKDSLKLTQQVQSLMEAEFSVLK